MKIVIAPDSFKECMSAREAARATAEGIHSVIPHAHCCELPISDGGEGLLDVCVEPLHLDIRTVDATDPLGRSVKVKFGFNSDSKTAVIEVAQAIGLDLVAPAERDAVAASSEGVGHMIAEAYANGARRFLIGLGGTATSDGGSGAFRALGGHIVIDEATSAITLSWPERQQWDDCEFIVACDVTNPLTGSNGAAAVFSPQKGATPEQIPLIDEFLTRWGNALEEFSGTPVIEVAGAGAAGGLGAFFLAVFNAQLTPGITMVLDAVDFDKALRGADLVITGEGKVDGQTRQGKAPWGVKERAEKYGVPTIAICGQKGQRAEELIGPGGFRDIIHLGDPDRPLAEALAAGPRDIFARGAEIAEELLDQSVSVGRKLAWTSEILDGLNEDADGFAVFSMATSNVYEQLLESASRYPEKLAIIVDSGHEVSYQQLVQEVDALSYLLRDCGVEPGGRVGLLLENSIEFVVGFYAANAIGATACPLPGKLRHDELQRLIGRAHIDVLLVEEDWAQLAPQEECDVIGTRIVSVHRNLARGESGSNPKEFSRAQWVLGREVKRGQKTAVGMASVRIPAILMFTSGTTSTSKGVLLDNRAVTHAVEAYRRTLGITANDSCLIAVPMYHITGMVAIIALMLACGGALHVHRRFDADHFLDYVNEHEITFVHASPTVFSLLLEARERHTEVPSLRMLASGAAYTPTSMINKLHDWMPQMEFRTIYGLTETTSPATVMPHDAAGSPKIASSGLPIPGLEVVICDTHGKRLPAGQHGEIRLKGTNITIGYDSSTGVSALTEDGWLTTGDVGFLDEDGFLYVVDRIKDMVNRGGEKVWCVDVEEALRTVDYIHDAAVVAVPDELYGEVPAALLVLDADSPQALEALDVHALRAQLKVYLATHEIPEYFDVAAAIPLTVGLKVNKREIRQHFYEVLGHAPKLTS